MLLSDAAQGIAALDVIYPRIVLSKALNPLNKGDFNVIVARLGDALRKQAAPYDKAAVKKAMESADVDWKALSDAQTRAAVDAINTAIKNTLPARAVPSLTETIKVSGEKVVKGTKKETAKRFKLDVRVKYTQVDETVVANAATSQATYITNEYGRRAERASAIARKVVAQGLEEGLSQTDIGEGLEEALSSMQLGRSRAYFDMVSAVAMNRARVFASLSAFEQADIEQYMFEAVLDSHTTLMCRFMHGRTFEVEGALKRHRSVAAGDGDVETTMPWMGSGTARDGTKVLFFENDSGKRVRVANVDEDASNEEDETGSFTAKMSDRALEAKGVCMPPLHAACRSTVIPVF